MWFLKKPHSRRIVELKCFMEIEVFHFTNLKFHLSVFWNFLTSVSLSITESIFLTNGSSVSELLLTGYLKNGMSYSYVEMNTRKVRLVRSSVYFFMISISPAPIGVKARILVYRLLLS